MARLQYKLGTVLWQDEYRPVAKMSDGLVDISLVLGASGPDALVRSFSDWLNISKEIEQFVRDEGPTADRIPIVEASIQAPLMFPAKIICAGANYYDHVAEMGIADIKAKMPMPYFFFKPPTTTIVGPGETIEYPSQSNEFDWEVELAAIIGKRAKGVAVDEALDIVACYAIAIDLTARDIQLAATDLFKIDWYGGKAQDTTCPLGPFITPADFIQDPQDLTLELSVNNVQKQNGSTSGMVYSTAELVSSASTFVTLEPGDVILTGSPAGVGAPSKSFLEKGDKIVANCPQLGRLEVQVRRS